MRKLFRKLTEDQKARGIIFSSCLSEQRCEQKEDIIHEVTATQEDKDSLIVRYLDDKFFNKSHWKFNIIRQI